MSPSDSVQLFCPDFCWLGVRLRRGEPPRSHRPCLPFSFKTDLPSSFLSSDDVENQLWPFVSRRQLEEISGLISNRLGRFTEKRHRMTINQTGLIKEQFFKSPGGFLKQAAGESSVWRYIWTFIHSWLWQIELMSTGCNIWNMKNQRVLTCNQTDIRLSGRCHRKI